MLHTVIDAIVCPRGIVAIQNQQSRRAPRACVQEDTDVLLNQQIVSYLALKDGIYHVQHGGPSDSTEIFQILADEYAREILLAADRDGPKTAKALSKECDASLATVYRRVSKLQDHGLIEERRTVDSDGSHRSEFETALEELHIDITDGQLSLAIETRDELADNFTALWSGLRGDE